MDKITSAVIDFLDNSDNRSFSIIYNELRGPLFSFILQKIKDRDTAEDILSYTFEKIYLALKNNKYTPQKNIHFKTWAHSCAKNAILYYLRYYAKTYSTDINGDAKFNSTPSIDIDFDYSYTEQTVNDVVGVINSLPKENHLYEIGYSYYLEGEKLKDIGNRLGYHKSSAKYKLSKIRKIIKDKVKYEKN